MADDVTKLGPLGNRIIVRTEKKLDARPSGLIIPDSAKGKSQEGVVIAVGKGKIEAGELIPMVVKPGDTVMFGQFSGTEIKVNDETVLILHEDDVLAIISPRKSLTK